MATVAHPAILRRRVRIRGVVQGVGFRPYVYKLAKKIGLRGFVLNSSSGVTIEIEGVEAELDGFVSWLQQEPPPLARIEELTISDIEPTHEAEFAIRESLPEPSEFVLVSPDVATCTDCW